MSSLSVLWSVFSFIVWIFFYFFIVWFDFQLHSKRFGREPNSNLHIYCLQSLFKSSSFVFNSRLWLSAQIWLLIMFVQRIQTMRPRHFSRRLVTWKLWLRPKRLKTWGFTGYQMIHWTFRSLSSSQKLNLKYSFCSWKEL